MKKLLVLTAALALFATPSFAIIFNGPHDFSEKGLGTDEICVFCHTPHAAVSTTSDPIPLSNRNLTGSAFCMSCHDGEVSYNDVSNKVNGTTPVGAYTAFTVGDFTPLLDNDGLAGYANNNHPVGAIFTPGGVMQASAGSLTLGAGSTVECFSCHQVHAAASPLLAITSNADSALCTTCHAK